MSKTRKAAQRGSKRASGPRNDSKASKEERKKGVTAKPHSQLSQQKPTIPFGASDDVLLIGEGGFSRS